MFGKKRKIKKWLQEKGGGYTLFSLILSDYTAGDLKKNLRNMGLRHVEIHVDWFEDIKCLGVLAAYENFNVDVQLSGEELALGCSDGEPDCDEFYDVRERRDKCFYYDKIKERIAAERAYACSPLKNDKND